MAERATRASIDMRGKKVTTYILHDTAMKLRDMETGEVVELVTDDFEPIESDVRAWCRMTGHKLVELERDESSQRYFIEKAEPREMEDKLALVVSNPGLEELLSPLSFALGAALTGTEVSIYFQGPAVRVLAKGFKATLRGLGRPFSVFARRGMANTGHIPPQDKLNQLNDLGARFYACGPSMDHFGVKKSEFIFDDITISEYLTFLEVMKAADIQIYPQ